MKKDPNHNHLLVVRSCLKFPSSAAGGGGGVAGYLDETENSSWSQSGGDDSFFLGESLQDDHLVATAVTKEKKVSFAKKACRKKTIALEQFTKQEYHDTWYTHEELRAIYRKSAASLDEKDDKDHNTDAGAGAYHDHQRSEPPASSSCSSATRGQADQSPAAPRRLSSRRRKWSVVLTSSSNKSIQEASPKDHSQLMGLTTIVHRTRTASSMKEEQKQKGYFIQEKEPTIPSKNRQSASSSIFALVQKKLQRQSPERY
jgi:hypothetical protein